MVEAWMKFAATGSVTDYLKFKGIEAENMPGGEEAGMALGKEQYGTEYCSDRNGPKCNADWRL